MIGKVARRRPRGRSRILERHVERQLVDLLRYAGWQVHRLEADLWRSKRSATREAPGTPDFIVVRPRRDGMPGELQGFYLEVKRPGGRLRQSQRLWIEAARAGGLAVVVADGVETLVAGVRNLGFDL